MDHERPVSSAWLPRVCHLAMSVILVVFLVTSMLLSWAWIAICDATHLQCEWIVFAWLGMLVSLVYLLLFWVWSRALKRNSRATQRSVRIQAVAILVLGVMPGGVLGAYATWSAVQEVEQAMRSSLPGAGRIITPPEPPR